MNPVAPYDVAWLSRLPDLHSRLQGEPPARVADLGCGEGWFGIALAQRYPNVRVDGFDLNEENIDLAWSNAHQYGLTDRLTFHVRDVSDATLNGRYDLCVAHHGFTGMRNPIAVLATMRRLVGEQGSVLVTAPRIVRGARLTSDIDAAQLRRLALPVGFRTVDLLSVGDHRLYCYRLYL